MPRQIIVMFCSLFWLLLGPAWAQQPAHQPASQAQGQPRGALFRVSQGDHTLYLFGTIHVGAPDFYPLEPRVTAALAQASVLALEVDPHADPRLVAQALQRHGMQQGSAAAQLAPRYRKRLGALLRQYAIAPESVAGMKPWLLATVLTVSEYAALGYQTTEAVDGWLSQQARARGVAVVELESVEGQMALFDRMSAAEQLQFLQESIASIDDREQADQARQIVQAWRDADAAGFEALAAKAAGDASLSGRFVQRVLLEERNPALAEGIVQLLARAQDSLAAIGILHLVGNNSVPELLRQRGLAVQRIY